MGSSYRREDPSCTEDDCGQLVYIPCRLFVPNAWYHSCKSRRRYPDGLLRFGHHLQMRCWTRDLPDLVRQVLQREPLEVRPNTIGKPIVFGIGSVSIFNFRSLI